MSGRFSSSPSKQIPAPASSTPPTSGETETIGNPKYPLELFLRLINVSLKTSKIMDGLPKLDI